MVVFPPPPEPDPHPANVNNAAAADAAAATRPDRLIRNRPASGLGSTWETRDLARLLARSGSFRWTVRHARSHLNGPAALPRPAESLAGPAAAPRWGRSRYSFRR